MKEDSLPHFAYYDPAFSLPNRVLFNEILNKSIHHAKRHRKILSILLIEVQSQEQNNTALTLDISVLKEIGTCLVSVLRSEDVIAKLDGNQFIILLNDIGKPKFVSAVADKILQSLSSSLKTSIGICIYPTDGESLEDLIKKAEEALHKAKQFQENIYQFYTSEMDVAAREYRALTTALKSAIPRNELVLYYQPKLNIKTGNIAGLEALIRWVRPEHGIFTPEKFIEIAEDSGLMIEIGEWAIQTACKINQYWQEEGYEHITIALNFSPKQFYHPGIISSLKSIIHDSGLNPNYLELEIHETTVMRDLEHTTEILNGLKSIGINITLDHFGTGYTSIAHLKKFPINTVKIDKGFIKGIPNNPDDSAITSALIALAHQLGLTVVAEGVETAEQVEYLATKNCDMVQGYYLSYPLPAEKITEQFKKLMDKTL